MYNMYIKKQQKQGLKQQPTVEETMERCAKHHVGQGICLLNPSLSGYVWLKEPSMLRKKQHPTLFQKHGQLGNTLWEFVT